MFVWFSNCVDVAGGSLVFLFHLTPQGGGGATHLDSQQVGGGVQNGTTHGVPLKENVSAAVGLNWDLVKGSPSGHFKVYSL